MHRLGVWPFIVFTGIAFGGGGLFNKALVDDGVDPFTATWIPFVVSGLLGVAVGVARRHLRRSAVRPAVLLGVIASALPGLLFNLGFEELPAGIVTLLIALGPIVTAVVAHFVFADEPFNAVKASGLAVSIVGVGVLAAGSMNGGASGRGLVLVVIGSVIAGSGGVLSRKFVLEHGPMALLAPQLLVGGLMVLVVSRLVDSPLAPSGGFEPWQLAGFAVTGVSTYLAFLSLLKANQIGTTGQVSIVTYCIPLFGVLGGLFLFDDPLTVSLVLGGLLILGSVGLIARGSAA